MELLNAVGQKNSTWAGSLFANDAVSYEVIDGKTTRYHSGAQIQDYIHSFWQPGGLFDPAKNPNWKVDTVVGMHDNSATFVWSGDFTEGGMTYSIKYDVLNIILNDDCKIMAETAKGVSSLSA